MGAAIGLLGQYGQNLQFEFRPLNPNGNATLEWQIVSITSVVVMYLVTPLVFYELGRTNVAKFRTGVLILLTLASGFVGEMIGQTALLIVPSAHPPFPILFSIQYSLVENLDYAFTFLFVAFSGIAFARLRSRGYALQNASRRASVVISLIALGFLFGPNVWFGYFSLGLPPSLATIPLVLDSDLALLALPISQFLIFYYAGRKVSIVGRPLRYFGLLYIGAYFGAILGTILAVTLFGRLDWSMKSGISSSSSEYGIIFHNIPQSPLLILESLIPVQSLPFLAFFAMSVSRLRGAESPQLLLPATTTDQGEHLENSPSAAN